MFDPSCVFNFLTVMFCFGLLGYYLLAGFYTEVVPDPHIFTYQPFTRANLSVFVVTHHLAFTSAVNGWHSAKYYNRTHNDLLNNWLLCD